MAAKLILHGKVQGVFCRGYCSHYGKRLKIRGSATNLRDGTVRVLLDSDNKELLKEYISSLKNNPEGFSFYGRIDNIEAYNYSGPIMGDYQW